jgi:predicted nucleotide-binding protein
MRKSTRYYGAHFNVAALRATYNKFKEVVEKAHRKVEHLNTSVNSRGSGPGAGYTVKYNTLDECYAAAEGGLPKIHAISDNFQYDFAITAESFGRTAFDVQAPTIEEIDAVFGTLEGHFESCRIPNWGHSDEEEDKPVKLFIGHGRDSQWRDLKDHLQDKHGFKVVAYEIGSRAGHTIRDILTYMMDESSLAFLVMTGEDKQEDGTMRARQNVVHEAGLFQGRLGFNRAIVLLEEGTDSFSNVDGLQHIPFAKGHIASTFGEVLSVIWREFPVGQPTKN